MENDIIPYTEAHALKLLGFDEPCLCSYNDRQIPYLQIQGQGNHSASFNAYNRQSVNLVLAPLYQQAFRWFRDRHNLFGNICYNQITCKGYYIVFGIMNKTSNSEDYYSTYEEAELACLEKLIEIVSLIPKI